MQVFYQPATLKKGNSLVTDYFKKMKILSDTLAAVWQPLNNFETVSFLFVGLGFEYDPFVTSVRTRVDPLSLDEIYGHLLAHEMRLEQHIPHANLSQSSTNPRPPSGRDNYPGGCGNRGHGSSQSVRGCGKFSLTTPQISRAALARYARSQALLPYNSTTALIRHFKILPAALLKPSTLHRICLLMKTGIRISGPLIISQMRCHSKPDF